jgi:very-short-patch-repair endonuclease
MDSKKLIPLARNMRHRPTPAEKELWNIIRNRGVGGFKFVRQFPIPPYVVDFCCREQKLIIELDGSGHLKKEKEDGERSQFLESQGYRVLRFYNDQVIKDINQVYELILTELNRG